MTYQSQPNGEKISSWECPADAKGCETCVFLAKDALRFELEGAGLASIEERIEDSKIGARIHERGGVDILSCAERQMRAERIGRLVGEQIVYDSKAPGDA